MALAFPPGQVCDEAIPKPLRTLRGFAPLAMTRLAELLRFFFVSWCLRG